MRLFIFQQHLEYVKNNMNINRIRKSQTLVVLLIFMLVAVTIATTSVAIIISNAQNTRSAGQSMEAYYAAEAGIENASLQLLRNPEYSGETLQINSSTTVDITATHSAQYVVTSTGRSGAFIRVLQATFNYTDNILSVISWQELFP